MPVASPKRPKYSVWRNGASVSPAAERDLRSWVEQHSEREQAEQAREDRQFAVPDFIPDDGFDHHDPADSTCISFASPLPGERDPNACYHDGRSC